MNIFYKNSLLKIQNFYNAQINNSNIEIKVFAILKDLIPFECGKIYYINGDEKSLTFSYRPDVKTKFKISSELCINTVPFGIIEISRNYEFDSDEICVFQTCALIIANIIKDIEIKSIIKTQVDLLQEGIEEKSLKYNKILEEEKVKNKFIANVSHELRSPLNSIMGFTELLHSQFNGALNEKQLEYVDDIRISSLHLLNMVNEILDMSKIESGTMKLNLKEFELSMNVIEVLNILKPLYLKKHITINTEIPDKCRIIADYQKLQQILLNLLSNAIKYTSKKGFVEISASNTKQWVCISIKDNGCGIDKKNHKKIFNKFVQAAETSNSTGLGLTITKELVKLHNGKITVKSEINKGAEFIVKLPLI